MACEVMSTSLSSAISPWAQALRASLRDFAFSRRAASAVRGSAAGSGSGGSGTERARFPVEFRRRVSKIG